MKFRMLSMLLLLLAVPLALPASAVGQSAALQSTSGVGYGSAGIVSMQRTVTLDEADRTLGEALDEIAEQAGLRLVYGSDLVPVDRRLTIGLEAVGVNDALARVLGGTGVDFEITRRGQVILTPRVETAAVEAEALTGAIRGRVTDARTGEGIATANVWLVGTRWRTVTNSQGHFLIPAVDAGTYTIAAGRIGYNDASESVTVASGETVVVDIAVQTAPTRLDEIVATVTGEQRVREMGHVVGRVQVDSLVRAAPISTVSELLTGRVPGLQIITTSGTVGGEVNMRLRSAISENLSADPIVIVDGVRYASGTGYDQGETVGGFNVEPTSRLNDLNPNDIESIEVVKGPSAATLYGTDAANGVIVIRTKRGQAGPARWNAYVRAGINEMPDYHYPDSYWGWGSATSNCTLHNMSQGFCTQDSVTVIQNPLNNPDLTIFSPKPRMQYGANVAGGREGFSYYFSADYEEATGPIELPATMLDELTEQLGGGKPLASQLEPNRQDKFNLRANVVANVTDNATVRVDVGYTQGDTRQMAFGNPYTSSIQLRPDYDVPYGTTGSPLRSFARSSTEYLNRFTGSAQVEWKPTEWLRTRALLGMDMPSTHRYSLGMANAYENYTGEVTEDRSRALYTTGDFGATATFERGLVSSRTSAGVQYYRSYRNRLEARGTNLRPGGTSIVDAATLRAPVHSYRETVTLGSYLEQLIGYDDRFFLSGAVRVDGASSFGHDFQAAVYPKAGASWVISEEDFVPEFDWLGDVRLRYAFGASGQQPLPDMGSFAFTSGQIVYGGSTTNRVAVTRLPSPDLRPERIREHEVGMDVSLLDDRLNADLTWSWRAITDQIRSVTLPQNLGMTWTNVGFSTGKSFEALLGARVIDRRNFSLQLTATHATNSTLLEDLGGMPVSYRMDGSMVEGFPLGARFMREIVSYEDTNGNGYLELDEVVMSDTAVFVGVSTPTKVQTLSAVVGLLDQRVRLSALFDRQAGYMQYDQLALMQRIYGNQRASVDATAPFSEQAKIIAAHHGNPEGQPAAGYFEIEPGDHTRLREVSLSIVMPDRWIQRAGLRNAQLSISGRNLFLWTDYKSPDPAVGRFQNNFSTYSNNMPLARNWVVRMDVGF